MINQVELSLVGVTLTKEEIGILGNVSITRNYGELNYFGSSFEELHQKITEEIQRVGDNSRVDSEIVADISLRHVAWMCAEHEADSFWFAMRCSPTTSEYDVPRWHRDGTYFPSTRKVYKLVHSLVGAHTRFAKIVNLDKFIEFENRQMRGDHSIELRHDIDSIMEEIFPTHSAHQAVQFLVGHEGAVIHSEPPFVSQRLFYSVVVGTQEQISVLEGR